MTILLNYKDNNPYASLIRLPMGSMAPIVNDGIKYKFIGAYEIALKKWERLCLVLKSLFLTVITLGFALITNSLQDAWLIALNGSKTVRVYKEKPPQVIENLLKPPPIRETVLNTQIRSGKNLQELPDDLLNYTLSFLTSSEYQMFTQVNKKLDSPLNKQQAKLAEKLINQIKTHFAPDHPINAKFDNISKKYKDILLSSSNISKNTHAMFLEVVREISTLSHPLQHLRAINLEEKAKAVGLLIPDYFLKAVTKLTEAENEVRTWVENQHDLSPISSTIEAHLMACLRMEAPLLADDLYANLKQYPSISIEFGLNYLMHHVEFLQNPAPFLERINNTTIHPQDQRSAYIKSKFQYAYDDLCKYCLYYINVKKYTEAAKLVTSLSRIVNTIPYYHKYNGRESCSILFLWLILAKLDKEKGVEFDKMARMVIEESIFKKNSDIQYAVYATQLYGFYLMSQNRYEEAIEFLNKIEQKVRVKDQDLSHLTQEFIGFLDSIPRLMYYQIFDEITQNGDTDSINKAIELCEKIKKPDTRSAIRGKLCSIIEKLPPSKKALFTEYLANSPADRTVFDGDQYYEKYTVKKTIFHKINKDPYYTPLKISDEIFGQQEYVPYTN